jgi:hypothetical protein
MCENKKEDPTGFGNVAMAPRAACQVKRIVFILHNSSHLLPEKSFQNPISWVICLDNKPILPLRSVDKCLLSVEKSPPLWTTPPA